MQQGGNGKPTLKEILEQHQIDLLEVYEKCNVSLTEINALYENNIGLRPVIEQILRTVNSLKKEKNTETSEDYTLETMYTRHIYG